MAIERNWCYKGLEGCGGEGQEWAFTKQSEKGGKGFDLGPAS